MDETIVSLRNISKSFSGVQVLDGINLDLKKGEVHALVGENGAGKSTLMKILMGAYDRTSGDIVIDNEKMGAYEITAAKKNGVNMVPQELALVPALSAGENIMLGQDKGKRGFLSLKEVNAQAGKYLEDLGFDIDPEVRVDHYSIAYRQMISIAKAMADRARIIIMDEPTSSLSREEVANLMDIIFRLKEGGTTIVYISHLLDEIFTVADRITILRDGKLVKTLEKEQTDQREVVSYMVGEDLLRTQETLRTEFREEAGENKGVPMLELQAVRRKGVPAEVSFSLYPGEVVGVTGLIGAGKTELIKTILGLEKMEAGQILMEGKKVHIGSPQDAYRMGIANVPEDRKLEGLVLVRDVLENMSMAEVYRKTISTAGFINKKAERENAKGYVDSLSIKITGLEQRVNKLSGGNQQKIVLAKALLANPRILILDEPTRGIDIGAKAVIYTMIRELQKMGMSVLFFSSDVSEMSFVGDRVLIMRDNNLVAELCAKEATIENMLNYMAGGIES